MTYKDITPTYNLNRKVVNFGDFCKTCEEPKLKKMKRQTTPNSDERQKLPGNFKQKFNPVTRKIDNLSPEEVNDKLDRLEELEESVLNESHVDYDMLDEMTKLSSFNDLRESIRIAIDKFRDTLSEVGYDEGDNDHNQTFDAAVQEALDQAK